MVDVRKRLSRKLMKQHQLEGRTSDYVARTINCRATQVKYLERELDILLDKEDGTKKASWATKDEFKHRRGLNELYQVVCSKWVSSSPELRYDHGCQL